MGRGHGVAVHGVAVSPVLVQDIIAEDMTICLSTSPAGLSDSTTSLSSLAVLAFPFFSNTLQLLQHFASMFCVITGSQKGSRWKCLYLGCRCRTFFVP